MHLKTLLPSLLLVTCATARPDLLRRDGAFAVRGRPDPVAATEDKRHLNPGADSAAGAPEAAPAGFKRIEQIEYGDDFVSSVKAAIASSKSAAGGALPASTTESSLTTTTAASVVVNGKWVVASPTSTSAAPGPSSVGGANYGFALIAAYRYLHEG